MTGVMFRYQDTLPRLPVPDLEDTMGFYLDLVRPLLTEAEMSQTQRAADDFVRPRGRGEEQRRLVSRRDAPGMANWLEEFWDDWYLADDTPIPINVNPGVVISGSGGQVARAARLVVEAASFKSLVDRGELAPDMDGDRPRCMFEYPRILSSTRVPVAGRDRLDTYRDSRHIVVLMNGHIHTIEILDGQNHPHPVASIERALEEVTARSRVPIAPIGALTTLPRHRWAQIRSDHLVTGPNSGSLAQLERAILVLALDTGRPPPGQTTVDALRMALHGDLRNRWFDKSIQLIVASNGTAALCVEHSGFDGSTLRRFTDHLMSNQAESGSTSAPPSRVEELKFEVPPALAAEIDHAGAEADRMAASIDVAIVACEFGVAHLRRFGMRPDGFIQMGFQLAYHQLYERPASTYESVNMKHFLHGRTEAMRTVSPESVELTEAVSAGAGRGGCWKDCSARQSRSTLAGSAAASRVGGSTVI